MQEANYVPDPKIEEETALPGKEVSEPTPVKEARIIDELLTTVRNATEQMTQTATSIMTIGSSKDYPNLQQQKVEWSRLGSDLVTDTTVSAQARADFYTALGKLIDASEDFPE